MKTLILAVFANTFLFAANTGRAPKSGAHLGGQRFALTPAPKAATSGLQRPPAAPDAAAAQSAPAPEAAPQAEETPALDLLESLRGAEVQETLEEQLPRAFDNITRPGEPVDPLVIEDVRLEYRYALKRLGFKDFAARADKALASPALTEGQREVLAFNRWTRVFTDARELAVDVMAGLATRGFSAEAMESAAELTARLLSLQPTEAPSTLPSDVAKKDKERIVDWFTAVTVQNIAKQLERVVSDVAKTIAEPVTLATLPEPFMKQVATVKERVERLLVHMYTNAEAGQTRFLGRAMAAALTRFSTVHNRPEVVAGLRAKLRERDLHLENFVGDTLMVPDRAAPNGARPIKLKTGDFIGERSAGKEAAEITYAVRPPYAKWPAALKSKLLGSAFAMFVNPGHAPKLKPGKGWWTRLTNRLSVVVYALRKWLANRRYLQRGYSHVGVVSVEEFNGVKMAWALDNYPNAGEGGIRKIGIMEQYSLNGPFIRFGVSRFDAQKVWDAFHEQALAEGYKPRVQADPAVSWPAMLTRQEWETLRAVPRGRAPRLLELINKNAMWVLERMMTDLGVAFAYGFNHEQWRAYCSATLVLAYRMGSMFELQSGRDHWHFLVRTMKKLGIGKAKEQNLEGRIIWPGSFFVDPKVATHVMADFPKFNEVGRVVDPLSMPPYVEMDRALTRALAAKLQLSSENGIQPDEETVYAALRTHIDSSADKSRSKAGIRSNAAVSTGYASGLNELIGDEE